MKLQSLTSFSFFSITNLNLEKIKHIYLHFSNQALESHQVQLDSIEHSMKKTNLLDLKQISTRQLVSQKWSVTRIIQPEHILYRLVDSWTNSNEGVHTGFTPSKTPCKIPLSLKRGAFHEATQYTIYALSFNVLMGQL